MRYSRLAVLALLGLLSFVAACDEDDNGDELREVVFMAGFRPQANLPFVAVYVADAQGYFADEGLAVEIRHSTQGQHLQLLLAGEVNFTTGTGAQLLRRRADDLPLRAVALFGQRGDQGFVVRADSGIETPADFEGRSVGFKAGIVPAELLALLNVFGLSADDVDLRAVGFDERVFIEGGVDVFPVFLNNEPNGIRNAGLEIRVFDPADYGIATLGLVFLTEAGTVEDDAELVERFLRASLRGAHYAAEHIDEAIEIVLIYAEGDDPEHQRFLLETDLANAARPDGMGRASLDQWEALQQVLLRFDECFEGPVDLSTVFDGSFVDDLYDEHGKLK